MWIQNVSLNDIVNGQHNDPGDNTILIQILDPCVPFPKSFRKFVQIHQFEFLDIEDSSELIGAEEFMFSDNQALRIAAILRHAARSNKNILVHCHAGISRSGAVVEVGIMLGFDDPKKHRDPNQLVQRMLMDKLGLVEKELYVSK